MATSDDIISIIQQIRASAQNLSKDLDHQDSREETATDLGQLSLSFQDLKDILFSLTQADQENITREMHELLSGQEDFKTYTQDVQKILIDVKNRVKADKKVEDKVAQNLPEQHQDETPSTLLQSFGKLLEQFSTLNTKVGSK